MAEDLLHVMGIVLSSKPVSDYDRRVVILTRERGKIHCFAKVSRKQGTELGSGTRPFCFGEFWLTENRSSMKLERLTISNYFDDVTQNMDLVYLGYYFLELCDYYTRENGDEFEVLKLLYQALRALANERLDNRLVRAVFELRLMSLNGDFDPGCFKKLSEAGTYAVDFIIQTPVEKLFTFALREEVLLGLCDAVAANKRKFVDRPIQSELVLKSMEEFHI